VKPRVAVIDIGSNSIKSLVAVRDVGPFGVRTVHEKTLEVRISQGIGGNPPMLQAARIEAGVEAVRELWRDCQAAGPLAAHQIVATSAVRSAGNGHLFTEGVRAITGISPQVLSGAEEADAIALGVRTDPLIEDHLNDFTVFDLGGGSLELIRFEHHGVTDRTSLPLGAVRMTEQFFSDPSRPIPDREQATLARIIQESIQASGVNVVAPLVGCSGGLAALRHIVAARADSGSNRPGTFSRALVEALSVELSTMNLAERMAVEGMPARRADIFPAAMIVFRVLLELAGADSIQHSLHNLRYGLALTLLRGVDAS
jgi:exopolyphosphatase/guanosine-5'-triphosphate,3'-diphosphate pyrophosphatase